VLVLVFAAQTGRSVANLLSGAGWLWPKGMRVFTSLLAVMGGDPLAGLDTMVGAPGWFTVVMVWGAEITAMTVVMYAVVIVLRHWGPGRLKGMATEKQVRQDLGLARLDRDKHLIRPDLYPSKQQPSKSRVSQFTKRVP
jgi:hypothetical protein